MFHGDRHWGCSQPPCYLHTFFNILTVNPLEPGLPKSPLFLPIYHLLSTCLRQTFLAWQRQPFIPLHCLWSWVLQQDWYMARKGKTKSGTASWLHIHCTKVLKENLPFHSRNSGKRVLFLFTLPDATRKMHSRWRPRCALCKLILAASSCTEGFNTTNNTTVRALHFIPQSGIYPEHTLAVLASSEELPASCFLS